MMTIFKKLFSGMAEFNSDVLFTPQMSWDYYCTRQEITFDDIEVYPTVIGCFLPCAWKMLISQTSAKPASYWLHGDASRLHNGQYQGQSISLIRMPAGAPMAAATLEELIACGGQNFLFIGSGGSLQSHVTIGSLVIVQDAIRSEGTSYHYLPPKVPVLASKRWTEYLSNISQELSIPTFIGTTWTTDAPYRELKTTAKNFSDRGVLAIEMEAAALLAVAKVRKASAGIILIISDEHSADWHPAPETKSFATGVNAAVEVSLNAAYTLAESDLPGDEM